MRLIIILCVICFLAASTTFGFSRHLTGGNSSARSFDGLVAFDHYFSSESSKTKRERLKHLAEALENKPSESAYIVSYGTINPLNCSAIQELKFVRNYLVEALNIKPARFVLIDGGFSGKGQIQIYMVPNDARFPEESFKYRINDVLNSERKP